MRNYFLHLESIRKASLALRKEENTLPVNNDRIYEVKMVLNALLDDYTTKWPETADGACSCSIEGSEGCRPHVCWYEQCDTIVEGADFCSSECAVDWEKENVPELPNIELGLTIHEASERLNKRLKGDHE